MSSIRAKGRVFRDLAHQPRVTILSNIEHPLRRFHGATNRHYAPELARAQFFKQASDLVGVDAIAGHHQPNDRVPQELFEDWFAFARHFPP